MSQVLCVASRSGNAPHTACKSLAFASSQSLPSTPLLNPLSLQVTRLSFRLQDSEHEVARLRERNGELAGAMGRLEAAEGELQRQRLVANEAATVRGCPCAPDDVATVSTGAATSVAPVCALCWGDAYLPALRSHPISFTRAHGVLKYKIGQERVGEGRQGTWHIGPWLG